MKIKPTPGRAIRHPGTMRLLAKEGEDVPPSAFWYRLIANGDVENMAEEKSSTSLATQTEESTHVV